MDKSIYCGRGNDVPYDELMSVLNTSFGFFTPETEFLGLLPKLYREQYRPQDQNWVVTEDGVLTAAIGAYNHEIVVCGRRLPCRGVGNVAVHPDHRRKGYMKLAMNQAIADMVNDGIVMSTLGGRRQRYQYFGYDKVGPIYHFHISRDNLRHTYGDLTAPFTIREVTDPADPAIDEIMNLNESQPVLPIRPRDRYLDIANTWKAKLLVCLDGDRFVGYCILDGGNSVSEMQTVESGEFMGFVRTLYAALGEGFGLNLPFHHADYIRELAPMAEGLSIGCAMHFNILDYRAVTEAFLALKQTYTTLPEGERAFLIHGFAGDERIRVSVKNGEIAVEDIPADIPVDHELNHLEAMAFLFSPVSPIRDGADHLCKLWFPLPACMYRADEV